MIEVQIHVAAPCLLHDHPLRRADQPHTGDVRILEDLLELEELAVGLPEFIHGRIVRQLHVVTELCHRRQSSGHETPDGGEFLHIPGQQLRQLEEGQGLSGRRAVHEDPLILPGQIEVPDLEQGKKVLQPRDHEAVPDPFDPQTRAPGQIADRAVDLRILLPHQVIGVQLQDRQTGGDLPHLSVRLHLEDVPQVVGHIRAHQEGVRPLPRAPDSVRRRGAGLADTALSGKNKDSALHISAPRFSGIGRLPGASPHMTAHLPIMPVKSNDLLWHSSVSLQEHTLLSSHRNAPSCHHSTLSVLYQTIDSHAVRLWTAFVRFSAQKPASASRPP